ncbi:LacI family transcriptional regulator [Microlunatus elymi]|uniref:LacI family transcriptional regulator n=1 Tax=Microlunatus elymi TaxID=2596828 RepID=A0A516Q146_9ACTN|nr:LacI family DNA-binding transcriptional regulator [Microlunatus elymi]QDP97102.1 LacI family transcriptional regulator [Microlunatus elymi]
MARVGIREVAAYAGVSMGTVSHFLNHPDRVSAQKADRIQQAIDQLGFVRNNAARQLRLGHSTTIAYIAPDVSNPFFSTLAEGAEERAAEAGYSVFLANSKGERHREDSYLALFQEYGVRGLLVGSPLPIEDRLQAIRRHGTPSVLVGRRAGSELQPSVSIDDVLGGRLAAEHLIKTGRRRIAFVGGPISVQQVSDRLQGASVAVRESGTATLEVIDVGTRLIATGHEVGAAIAARPRTARPTAIFTANDLIAIGLAQTLSTSGIDIGADIAIVGYDNIEYAENAIVPLSSIRPPHEEFGRAAIDLLLETIDSDGPLAEPHRVFAPELVIRASSAKSRTRRRS